MYELQTVDVTAGELPSFSVIVDFGSGIPADDQGPALLHMEQELREKGIPAEVYKRTMQDDSKLRRSMTEEQRKRL